MSDWKIELQNIIEPAIVKSATIRELIVERGAIEQCGAVVKRCFEGERVIVFADEAGFAAAGEKLVQSLEAAHFAVECHIITARPLPKPTVELAETFRSLLKASGSIPVALGSGVINDLVKYSANCENLAYCSVATAASMDGYASAGAPLARNGFKMTIPARAPRVILADLDIIAAAPGEMAGWGYGDLAGKVPAGGDWIIADSLGIEAIDDVAWPLVQDNLPGWLAQPSALANGDFAAIARLFAGLTAVGLAMEFHGSSRPASGADHQIAHLWEMEGLQFNGQLVSHGACVSVGCMTTLAFFDWLIEQDLSAIVPAEIAGSAPSLADKFAEIGSAFDDRNIIERARQETAEKHLSTQDHEERLHRLQTVWPEMRARLRRHMMRSDEMAKLLRAAGAPVNAGDIGVGPDHLRSTFLASRFIRARYTVLDLLAEAGLLQQAVDAVFGRAMSKAG